jgi:Bacteriocin-protection, YdeI or OmpD-Associated/Domain of unknown function (DUF1905)
MGSITAGIVDEHRIRNKLMPSFATTLLPTGKNTTGIGVPESVVAELGAGKKPKVVVTLNGFEYRSSIAVMGGDFMIPVSAEIRANAGVSGGDAITVSLAVDTEERVVSVPAEFSAALQDAPIALARFEALSYSRKSAYTLAIEAAKTDETRAKRIAKAIAELSDQT